MSLREHLLKYGLKSRQLLAEWMVHSFHLAAISSSNGSKPSPHCLWSDHFLFSVFAAIGHRTAASISIHIHIHIHLHIHMLSNASTFRPIHLPYNKLKLMACVLIERSRPAEATEQFGDRGYHLALIRSQKKNPLCLMRLSRIVVYLMVNSRKIWYSLSISIFLVRDKCYSGIESIYT